MTKWTRQEFVDAVWEVYRDYCKIAAHHDGVQAFRLPDYEDALKELEEHGLPPKTPTKPIMISDNEVLVKGWDT